MLNVRLSGLILGFCFQLSAFPMSPHRHHRSADRPRQRALRLTYQVADALTEVFLSCEVIFTPWAFGTTQPWSIRVMNGLGYLLGALLLTKGLLRWLGRYQPARWDRQLWNGQSPSSQTRFVHPGLVRHLTWVMGGLSYWPIVLPAP